MNRAYKLVWNTVFGSWVVASELAKGAKKSSGQKSSAKKSSGKTLKIAMLIAAGLSAGSAWAAPAANALPTGESVASGSATFDRSVTNQLTITQTGNTLITNWGSFNIGSSGKVVFAQPSATSVALNRVNNGSATEIFGKLSANGLLVVVNPNGITVGASGQVNAASIIGSVLDIQDSDFNNGSLRFDRGGATGVIDNKGSLTATAGSVSLLAPTVKNSGSISATGGNASLINADAVNLTAADPSISSASSISGLIQQSGSITAIKVSSAGGKVLLTGDNSQSASRINLAGTVDASETAVAGYGIVVTDNLNINGASNTLNLVSSAEYTLTNGAAVNVNGASSGFSLNGIAYTLIRDIAALQLLNSGLSGKYVLANNIDATATAGWNSGAGFTPIGDNSTAFSGILDGLGHSISGLTINRPSTEYVGLVGKASNATLQNITLNNASISGSQYVGALVGYNLASGGVATLFNNRVSGTVSAALANLGGITGYNSAIDANSLALVSQNISSASINMQNAAGNTGGIVGRNGGNNGGTATVQQNYFNGSINSIGSKTGGIVGLNQSSSGTSLVQYNNVAGSISSSSYDTGGVVGQNYRNGSSVVYNFSGAVIGSAGNVNFKGGLVGYNDTALVSNNYWNTETAGLTSAGSGVSTANNISLTTALSRQLASYGNWSNIDALAGTGSIWRIYDGQSGPLLRSLLAPLSVTGSGGRTYDGTTTFSGAGYTLSSSQADFSKILGIESYSGTAIDARNAGTYSLAVSGLYSNQQGYDLSFASGDFVINKRQLTLTATAADKVYDGKLTAAGKPTITGRVRGDSISGLTQAFADKNAGTGKTLQVNGGYTIRDGSGGNNYEVLLVDSYDGVITPKNITLSTVANSKVYDGGLTSANKPVVTGLITGDRVTGLFQQYETKTVGENKKLLIKNGYVLQDGNNGSNYVVTEQGSNDGVITAH